jgi:hypothetical protein
VLVLEGERLGETPARGADGGRADLIAAADKNPLAPGMLIEVELDSEINFEKAALEDAIRARVARPVKDGEAVLIPEGALLVGRLVRLEKETTPFPLYEVGLYFDKLELSDRSFPFAGTMADAGPATGLLRQARRLDPKFTKRRTARMDILVREVQRGQGILLWDARRGAIPKGLRMKWRVDDQRQ